MVDRARVGGVLHKMTQTPSNKSVPISLKAGDIPTLTKEWVVIMLTREGGKERAIDSRSENDDA